MAKPKKIDLGDAFKDMLSEMQNTKTTSSVPNIVDFCEHPDYLGMNGQNGSIKLHPVQMLVLKAFYRGSIGNENLELTPEETELCLKHRFDSNENGNILEKWNNGEIFKELVLVWGRRSGKDFVSSVIALYEACKLLLVPGGDPYPYYHTSSASPITIVTVANSQEQASLAFYEMQDKMRNSKFFEDKIGPEGIGVDQIWFCTPKDREDNKKLAEKNHPLKKGSILIQIGHSNSAGLLGKGIFVVIFDEVASYKQNGGNSSGDRMYSAVGPAVKTYVRYKPLFDDKGNTIPKYASDGQVIKDKQGNIVYEEDKKNPIYDGKIVSISSPRGKEGKFWELYFKAHEVGHRLMVRAPTWVVNTQHTEAGLRKEFPDMTPEDFEMEFGAEFSGTAGEAFFPRDSVVACFPPNIQHSSMGKPGFVYYAHLDPASSSHNYALVVCHKENFMTAKNEGSFNIVVDHIHWWSPTPGNPIRVEDVDNYVISLKHRFHLGMVTYDQWQSDASIEKLKKKGIPAKLTRFTLAHKMKIYSNLYDLVIAGRIKLPPVNLLRSEMICLQRKFINQGWRVLPKADGDCRTDDLCDALAGAVYGCLSVETSRLPTGRLIATGLVPTGNARMWQGMQGPIGYGTGGQVSGWREQRASWPNSLR